MLPGSPPLAREQHIYRTRWDYWDRITPARAGTTIAEITMMSISGDHPRSRGNNLLFLPYPTVFQGSPPLAREQHRAKAAEEAAARITPARAGTTQKMAGIADNL